MPKIALIANPNAGKTTLFNALTGSRQKVGNWPGVTVDRKSGYFTQAKTQIEVIDLPGVYSLADARADMSLDVGIAYDVIASGQADLFVNIIDATNLERHLYLTMQLLEMQVPLVVVVNMMDALQGKRMDLRALATRLGYPVVGISATRKTGIASLKQMLLDTLNPKARVLGLDMALSAYYPKELIQAAGSIQSLLKPYYPPHKAINRFVILCCLDDPSKLDVHLPDAIKRKIATRRAQVVESIQEDIDIAIADARYTKAHNIATSVMYHIETSASGHGNQRKTFLQRLDTLVLNRVLGIPIFLLAMYLMFFFAINIGGAFQPFFDQVGSAIFVDGLAQLLQKLGSPVALTNIVTLGLGNGINTVLNFIPILGCLFLWLSFLESSGYMSRAAFVVDRLMRAVGLPGKAFVPLIVGFGCNVPAILATRTLEYRRDRLLTLMMSPFMSCGARLAIYAIFIAAFFPKGGQDIVFMLYFIGIFIAIATGFLLRKTLLAGEASPWILELPPYRCPTPSVLLRATWHRLKLFLWKAGRYIVPVCFLVGTLNAFDTAGHAVLHTHPGQETLLSHLGKSITPAFSPMGIRQENWPATVGLLSGILAKEVVVGTLNTLYTQVAGIQNSTDTPFDFKTTIRAAFGTIPKQLVALKDSLKNPIAASSADASMNRTAMGVMATYFDGKVGAIAYLLFVLLYFPCISATAALARESSNKWALFSVLWTTGIAYMVAVLFYQVATWHKHPMQSLSWVATCMGLQIVVICGMRRYASLCPSKS